MAKYKIIFDREACIGALACVKVAPEFYLIANDGKVDLKGATFNEKTQKYELIIEDKYFSENTYAERVCPVQAIELIRID